jgi:hypothetical protein
VNAARTAALAAAALAASLAAATGASAATASFLVYECGSEAHPTANDQLCRVDADMRGFQRLMPVHPDDEHDHRDPSLSRNGKLLAYAFGFPNRRLFVNNRDGTSARAITETDVWAVAASPDGRTIAFVETRSPVGDENPTRRVPVLHSINADGTGRRVVADGATDPTWLGNRIVAVPGGDLDGGPRACVIGADGGCERVVADASPLTLSDPAVSPNGKYVAAVLHRNIGQPLDDGIWVFSAKTGKRLRRLTSGINYEQPTWSPDSQAVAWSQGSDMVISPRVPPVRKLSDDRPWSPQLGQQPFPRDGEWPTWGGKAGTRPAGLRITSTSVSGDRLRVRGTVDPGARTPLHVTFEASGPSYGVEEHSWPVPKSGRFSLSRKLGANGDEFQGCTVVVSYVGDSKYLRATDYAKTRGGVCPKRLND